MLSEKHLLFDFDGTLVDSMPYWGKAMLAVLDNHKISYPDDVITIITPLGMDKTCEYFMSLGLAGALPSIKKEIYDILIPMYENEIVLKSGVKQTLLSLLKKGYKLHILTASPHLFLDPCLKRNEAYSLFENIWSCDDFGVGKTNPEIYKSAARRIGIKLSDMAFMDDNINAVSAAKAAKVKTIGIYDASSKEFITQMRQTADIYINSFGELLNYIE